MTGLGAVLSLIIVGVIVAVLIAVIFIVKRIVPQKTDSNSEPSNGTLQTL